MGGFDLARRHRRLDGTAWNKDDNLKLELSPGGVDHTQFDMPNAPPFWGKFVYREVAEHLAANAQTA